MSYKWVGLSFLFSSLSSLSCFGEVDFTREVRPILSDKCFACHGFDEETREADLRLDTQDGSREDLGGYVAIEPGKPKESEVYLRIMSDDEDDIMPPTKFHKTLTAHEKEIIRQWILQGAEYEEHWSYREIASPEPPKGHPGNAIDAFLGQRLKEKNLAPSPAADPITLLRRLSWDLRGLPPTGDEVTAFLNDPQDGRWERWVDRFLNDPKYGERMAVWWLDLVRYADTIGYHSDAAREVSAYRDYVINAFNQNKGYHRFTIEQLAGDLLPNPTTEQLVASGYNRLLQTTEEGGAQEKEYRAIYAADRVRSVSDVFLGSTLGCAQCHDHKYDPFSAKDFYSMAAFFADLKENGVGKRQPNLQLPTPEETQKLRELDAAIALLQEEHLLKDEAFRAKVLATLPGWERTATSQDSPWTIPPASGLNAPKGTRLELQPDGSILARDKVANNPTYSANLKAQGTITALRLEALTDPSFKTKDGFSRDNGNFVLTGLELTHEGKKINFSGVLASVEQDDWPAKNAIDGKKDTGWAVGAHTPAGRKGTPTLVLILEKPLQLGDKETNLHLALHFQSGHQRHSIERFRLSTTDRENPNLDSTLALPGNIIAILKKADRSPEEVRTLSDFYLKSSPEMRRARDQQAALEKEKEQLKNSIRSTLVSEAMPTPRITRILPRGNWLDDSGPEVQPAVPEFLPHTPVEGRRANRLDLAHWILSENNPLTARAATNRLWRLFFGRGLAANVTDLGGQGQPPSHPELLDWLSHDFRENDWDIKALVKTMVMSRAYRQQSTADSLLREKDPGNQLYSRQGRWRVDAEFVRDTALQASGLLHDEQVGGTSVKPYQPAGYWQHLNFPKRTWQPSTGIDLYRRSLYTFWCRTFLHPSMLAFDAPSREECTAERARSNIPQQALALLNDPIFVEAARKFGERIHSQPGSTREKITWGMREITSRDATTDELNLLENLYTAQLARFSSDEPAAKNLLATGDAPVTGTAPPAELAAWTQVGRTLINAYEATSRF
ncbi:MAG: PSD1 and planctomycete cytochrome C domain-containing protein [Verrucomicrobiaceae bacterium]